MGINNRAELISKNLNFLEKLIYFIDLEDLLMNDIWEVYLK